MPNLLKPDWVKLFADSPLSTACIDHARILFSELTRCHKTAGSDRELLDVLDSLVLYYQNLGLCCWSDENGFDHCELVIGTLGEPLFLDVVLQGGENYADDEFRTRCGVFVEAQDGPLSVQFRYNKFGADRNVAPNL